MSFWKNPENNSLKVLLLLILVAIGAFFTYTHMHGNSLTGKGQVISSDTTRPAETSAPELCIPGSSFGPTFCKYRSCDASGTPNDIVGFTKKCASGLTGCSADPLCAKTP